MSTGKDTGTITGASPERPHDKYDDMYLRLARAGRFDPSVEKRSWKKRRDQQKTDDDNE